MTFFDFSPTAKILELLKFKRTLEEQEADAADEILVLEDEPAPEQATKPIRKITLADKMEMLKKSYHALSLAEKTFLRNDWKKFVDFYGNQKKQISELVKRGEAPASKLDELQEQRRSECDLHRWLFADECYIPRYSKIAHEDDSEQLIMMRLSFALVWCILFGFTLMITPGCFGIFCYIFTPLALIMGFMLFAGTLGAMDKRK